MVVVPPEESGGDTTASCAICWCDGGEKQEALIASPCACKTTRLHATCLAQWIDKGSGAQRDRCSVCKETWRRGQKMTDRDLFWICLLTLGIAIAGFVGMHFLVRGFINRVPPAVPSNGPCSATLCHLVHRILASAWDPTANGYFGSLMLTFWNALVELIILPLRLIKELTWALWYGITSLWQDQPAGPIPIIHAPTAPATTIPGSGATWNRYHPMGKPAKGGAPVDLTDDPTKTPPPVIPCRARQDGHHVAFADDDPTWDDTFMATIIVWPKTLQYAMVTKVLSPRRVETDRPQTVPMDECFVYRLPGKYGQDN